MYAPATVQLLRIHFEIVHIRFQPVEKRQHEFGRTGLQIMGYDYGQISVRCIITRPRRRHRCSPDTLKIGRIYSRSTYYIVTSRIEDFLYQCRIFPAQGNFSKADNIFSTLECSISDEGSTRANNKTSDASSMNSLPFSARTSPSERTTFTTPS